MNTLLIIIRMFQQRSSLITLITLMKMMNLICTLTSCYKRLKENAYRVTLHLEYEYSNFVGQLLPQNDGKFDYTEGVFSASLKYAN